MFIKLTLVTYGILHTELTSNGKTKENYSKKDIYEEKILLNFNDILYMKTSDKIDGTKMKMKHLSKELFIKESTNDIMEKIHYEEQKCVPLYAFAANK